MRVVLDSNILARATPGRSGPARELLLTVAAAFHELILSPFLLVEIAQVLNYDRLRPLHGLDDAGIREYVEFLQAIGKVVVPSVAEVSNGIDPDDTTVLLTAAAGNADVLCTLDHDFHHPDVLAFAQRNGFVVLSDLELLARLRSNEEKASRSE